MRRGKGDSSASSLCPRPFYASPALFSGRFSPLNRWNGAFAQVSRQLLKNEYEDFIVQFFDCITFLTKWAACMSRRLRNKNNQPKLYYYSIPGMHAQSAVFPQTYRKSQTQVQNMPSLSALQKHVRIKPDPALQPLHKTIGHIEDWHIFVLIQADYENRFIYFTYTIPRPQRQRRL